MFHIPERATNKIIAISGVSGVGKTTLTNSLANFFQCTQIKWDDFDDISQAPIDYVEWKAQGGNYDEWNYPELAKTLQHLKTGIAIFHPISGELLAPTQYIVFDAPLGRLHQQTALFIDFCIHIEAPLDVSLARRILRDFKDSDKTKDDLLAELEFYLTHSRHLFFDDALKKSADFIVDGMLPVDTQVKQILQVLKIDSK